MMRELADSIEEGPEVVIRALELQRDRPLSVDLPGVDGLGAEPANRQARLQREGVDPAQQIGGVLLFRKDRLETLEPRFELRDLATELVQLSRGCAPLSRRAFMELRSCWRAVICSCVGIS